MTVYEPSYIFWFYRKWNQDNKDEVVRFLQDFYRSVDQSTEQLTLDISRCSKDECKKGKLIHVAINLAEKIRSSITGIENLSKTYFQYPKTTSALEGMIQDYAIVTYKQLLEHIPHDRLSKDLRRNVVYCGAIIYVGISDMPSDESAPDPIHNPDE